MQNEFKQASGQLLNPGVSECSPSWEAPESNSWGFVCPRILGGKTRLEDVTVIAVAWNYTSFGFGYIPSWFISLSWYFRPGMLELLFFFLCGLETEFPLVERKRFRTIHSSANWNWEPSQHVRTWTAKTGGTRSPLGRRHSWGARELGWNVPSAGSLLPAPGQAQRGPDPVYAPSPADILPFEL